MCKRNFIHAVSLAILLSLHAVSLTILFALQATTSLAQEAMGKATSVIPQAESNHAGPLSSGSNVYLKETVRTGQTGQVDLQFKDNTNLKVGSNSSVHLDKFVYDPNKSTGDVALEATRGTFRFVTGSQGTEAYKIKTPYGHTLSHSIGLRPPRPPSGRTGPICGCRICARSCYGFRGGQRCPSLIAHTRKKEEPQKWDLLRLSLLSGEWPLRPDKRFWNDM